MMAFSSLARSFWERLMLPHFLCLFFFKWRSVCAHQSHFLAQDQSKVAQWAEMTGWLFPEELHVNLFPWQVPTLYLDSIVSPLWLHWVKGVCVFRCNLPSALFAEWSGFLLVEWTLSKSQHRKLTPERKTTTTQEQKILLRLLLGFKLTTVWSQVLHSSNKLSQLPKLKIGRNQQPCHCPVPATPSL